MINVLKLFNSSTYTYFFVEHIICTKRHYSKLWYLLQCFKTFKYCKLLCSVTQSNLSFSTRCFFYQRYSFHKGIVLSITLSSFAKDFQPHHLDEEIRIRSIVNNISMHGRNQLIFVLG
jgi:hypothetical protein